MCEKMSSLNIGAKICDDCRKKLAQLPTKVSESEELPESSEEDGASSYSEHAGASGCSDKTVHSPLQSMNQCLNLCYHEADFGVPAEWHFSATSHGKGACDGVGGSVKRLAARASLQRPYDQQIMTPRQLFEWAVDNISGITFKYCSCEEYKSEELLLEQRFKLARTIPGTRKLHSFVPVTRNTIATNRGVARGGQRGHLPPLFSGKAPPIYIYRIQRCTKN